MLGIFGKLKTRFLFCLLVFACSFCCAGEKMGKSAGLAEGGWDPAKYISIDEVQPGMEAYCLTAYKSTEVEKFGLEVLDVVRNVRPGRDAILVQGTDERFIRTGPVWGCSGSPVYINGRLAGALAFAWTFSKDPLYGVTPIEEMLRVDDSHLHRNDNIISEQAGMGFVFDFSRPIDFAEIDKQITARRASRENVQGGMTFLPCPLITSGLPAEVCEQLGALVEPFGLMVVAGIGGGVDSSGAEDVQLAPGACLVVPLVTGDITAEAIGTVTEVQGDKVYGFGHSFLGYGPIDLPMATGKVHTVVSNVYRSFKLASALEIVGALTTDESTAVFGRIGAKAKMIPLTITVDRYNDPEKRVYNCQVANNRLLTPLVLRYAVAGAVLMLGNLPPEHMIKYKVAIGIEGADAITFENVSTSLGLAEVIMEGTAPVAILLNNPYEKVDIKSVDCDIRIMAKNITSRIWSVDLSDSKVKAGEHIEIEVIVQSFLAEKKKYRYSLKIPEKTAPGKYDLILCGGYGYQEFLRRAAPYKFIPQNLVSLIEAMNNLLAIKRDKLYFLLVLPAGGVAVEAAELPDLPATKALVLGDAKRTLRTQPYPHWVENSLETGTVIIDKKVMRITVEK